MRLTILYVPDCPNVATLQDRLAQVIPADGVELALRLVDSEELAAELGMTGSPTLLIDGVDPFAEPGGRRACPVGSTATRWIIWPAHRR